MNDDPWHGILARDEQILWQGQPSTKVRVKRVKVMEIAMAAFFVGFSIFWMNMAAKSGGVFWMLGLIFLGVGLWNLIGVHFQSASKRKSTFYTLTDRRAIIAVDARGKRSLNSYPITPDTAISLIDGTLSDILFAQITTTHGKNQHVRTKRIGFEMIPNGREVFALFRQVQERAA